MADEADTNLGATPEGPLTRADAARRAREAALAEREALQAQMSDADKAVWASRREVLAANAQELGNKALATPRAVKAAAGDWIDGAKDWSSKNIADPVREKVIEPVRDVPRKLRNVRSAWNDGPLEGAREARSLGSAAADGPEFSQTIAQQNAPARASLLNREEAIERINSIEGLDERAKRHIIESLPENKPLHPEAIDKVARDVGEEQAKYADWSGKHGNLGMKSTTDALASESDALVATEKAGLQAPQSAPLTAAPETAAAEAKAPSSTWERFKTRMPWNKAAGATEKTVVDAGEKMAAGEAAGEIAAKTGMGFLGKVVTIAGGDAFVGAVPGLIETYQGVTQHDTVKTVKGGVSTATGIGGAIAGGMAGTAIGGTIGLAFPPAEVLTVPIGLIVGGIGGYLGFKAGNTAVDAVVGGARSAAKSVEETADQLRSHWDQHYKDYQNALKKYRDDAGKVSQQVLNDDSKAAGALGGELLGYLDVMKKKGVIVADKADEAMKSAQFDWQSTQKAVRDKLTSLEQSVSGAGKSTGAAATHSAGHAAGGAPYHDPHGKQYVAQMQEMLGFKDGDVDGLLGRKTRQALLDAGIIKSLDEIPLPPHGVASDAQLRKFFAEHADDLNRYAQGSSPAPESPAAPAPVAPATPAPPVVASRPAYQPARPVETPAAGPVIDEQLIAALRNMDATDIKKMHSFTGKLHEVGMEVYNTGAIDHEHHEKKLPYVNPALPEPGQFPPAAIINIMPESQRYTVTTADGTDITGKMPALSTSLITQAQKEHIGRIDVQEVHPGDARITTFVFSPVKTPGVDKGEQLQK